MNCWKPKVMLTKVISSQASDVTIVNTIARADEGSETRDRAKAVMSPRVPCILRDGDIVRYSDEKRRAGLNSQRNTCYGTPIVYSPRKNIIFINILDD